MALVRNCLNSISPICRVVVADLGNIGVHLSAVRMFLQVAPKLQRLIGRMHKGIIINCTILSIKSLKQLMIIFVVASVIDQGI